jgi:phosphatidylglycerol---prolipoprotein diacylglyceryl transferase
MLAYYIQTLNPFIWQWGNSGFGIRWYGMSYLLGFVFAYLLLRKFVRDGRLRLPPQKLVDFVLFAAIFGVLLGGRLGSALFYDPRMLIDFSPPFPYWGLLKLQSGGMSAHGGILGVLIAIWIFARRNKLRFLNLVDCAAMVAPIGLAFGRIANFINGELYGHIWHGAMAVQFPTELTMPPESPQEPTVTPDQFHQLVQTIAYNDPTVASNPSVLQAVLANPAAEIVNLARQGDAFVIAQLRDILPPRIPSQLIEASLEGLLLFVICYLIGRKWKKDGIATGAFATFYPIMRIIGEQFRVGDHPRLIFGYWISRGVLYSIPLLFLGLIFWIWAICRPQPPDAAEPQINEK